MCIDALSSFSSMTSVTGDVISGLKESSARLPFIAELQVIQGPPCENDSYWKNLKENDRNSSAARYRFL